MATYKKKSVVNGRQQKKQAAEAAEHAAEKKDNSMVSFGKDNNSTAKKVVIIVFAVILVLSMCLPFFSSCSSPSTTVVETSDGGTAEVVTSTAASTVSGLSNQYSTVIGSLESKLAADPENTTAMASLGNNYMDLASAMTSASDYADHTDVVEQTYLKAVEYYDMYLEKADSKAVHVDRDICLFYGGQVEQAKADLEAYTQAGGADYAMAWFNLGIFHYTDGEYEQAIDLFQKAIDLDADGSVGVAGTASLYQAIAQSMIEAEEADHDHEGEAAAESADTLLVEPSGVEPVEPASADESQAEADETAESEAGEAAEK